MSDGHRTWIFPDGDLPPRGEDDLPLEGHESLIVLNTGAQTAAIEIDVYFSEQEPELGLKVEVPPRRVRCFRVDQPLGDRQFQVPMGQYALRLRSSCPVIAQIGRADVRQPNLAYYTTIGFGSD